MLSSCLVGVCLRLAGVCVGVCLRLAGVYAGVCLRLSGVCVGVCLRISGVCVGVFSSCWCVPLGFREPFFLSRLFDHWTRGNEDVTEWL